MSVQQRIDSYWSERAPSYDDYQQRSDRLEVDQRLWARTWTTALPPGPLDVLDVGTGSGYVACVLARLGHRVTGIDVAEGMLDLARRHASGVRTPPMIVRGDMVSPPFPDASFDAVVGRYAMWTLREPQRALGSWRRLLRTGGRLAMVDATWFAGGWDAIEDGPGFTHYYDDAVRAALPLAAASSIEQTVDLVAANGFEDVVATPLWDQLRQDREHGVAPGHDVQLQYLITANRSATP